MNINGVGATQTASYAENDNEITAKDIDEEQHKGEHALYDWALENNAELFKIKEGDKEKFAYQLGDSTKVYSDDQEAWVNATAQELSAIQGIGTKKPNQSQSSTETSQAKEENWQESGATKEVQNEAGNLLSEDSMEAFNIFANRDKLPEIVKNNLAEGTEVFKSTTKDGQPIFSLRHAGQDDALAYIDGEQVELSDADQEAFKAASKNFVQETFEPMWAKEFKKVQSSAQGGHTSDEIQLPSNIQELNIRVASHRTGNSSGYKLGDYQWQRGQGVEGHFPHGEISEDGEMNLGSRRSYSFNRIQLINGREFDYRTKGYGHPFISVAQRTNQ